MEETSKSELDIYLPSLPNLGSKDISLFTTNMSSRVDLVTQLSSHNMNVPSIDGEDSWLKNIMEHVSRAVAFVFPPMTSLDKNHKDFKKEASKRWFEFFSVSTAAHVGGEEVYKGGRSKPCIMMDPDKQWQENSIDLLDYLKDMAMFKHTKVEDILQVSKAPGDMNDAHAMNKNAVELLQKTMDEKKGKTLKSVDTDEKLAGKIFDPMRKEMKRHHFGVCMFGSATTTENAYIKPSEELARMVGERGWRLVTGAGCKGCMGAFDRGFEKGKRNFNERYSNAKYKPAHVGVSTQSILRLEGPPDNLDQLIIAKDIYERMKIMLSGKKSEKLEDRLRDSAKVVFVAPGGVGTMHEFATMMQLATNGHVMDNRKIVLLDFPRHKDPKQDKWGDSQDRGFWKPLIHIAKNLGFDDHFVVAKSPDEAIAIADQEYKRWLDRNPDHKELPHPAMHPFNPKGLIRTPGQDSISR